VFLQELFRDIVFLQELFRDIKTSEWVRFQRQRVTPHVVIGEVQVRSIYQS